MEQTIRDVMTRVHGLRDRIEHQPMQASKDQLNAIHIALKGLLMRVKDSPVRSGPGLDQTKTPRPST